MADRYITIPFRVDPRDLMQLAFSYLQAKIPGWTPAEGNLDTWMIEGVAEEAADIGTLASLVPDSIFRYYGQTLLEFPAIAASAASVSTTWFAIDNAGHTIPGGTQVGISDVNGQIWPFRVVADYLLPGGQTSRSGVVLVAEYAGVGSSGLGSAGEAVLLLDTYDWVDHVTQDTVTSGGTDPEPDATFLDRVTRLLRTMSPRPILANDFAVLSMNVAGVQRAVAIDGYDPSNNTFNNERMITVIAVDSGGQPVSPLVKTAISAYLEEMREVNFSVHVMDASLQEVDITVRTTHFSGYDPVDVGNRIETTIINWINPATWGITRTDDLNNPTTWNNKSLIPYLELGALVNNVPGVDEVTFLSLGPHGGSQSQEDLDLTGIVPLPFTNPADIIVTVD